MVSVVRRRPTVTVTDFRTDIANPPPDVRRKWPIRKWLYFVSMYYTIIFTAPILLNRRNSLMNNCKLFSFLKFLRNALLLIPVRARQFLSNALSLILHACDLQVRAAGSSQRARQFLLDALLLISQRARVRVRALLPYSFVQFLVRALSLIAKRVRVLV